MNSNNLSKKLENRSNEAINIVMSAINKGNITLNLNDNTYSFKDSEKHHSGYNYSKRKEMKGGVGSGLVDLLAPSSGRAAAEMLGVLVTALTILGLRCVMPARSHEHEPDPDIADDVDYAVQAWHSGNPHDPHDVPIGNATVGGVAAYRWLPLKNKWKVNEFNDTYDPQQLRRALHPFPRQWG